MKFKKFEHIFFITNGYWLCKPKFQYLIISLFILFSVGCKKNDNSEISGKVEIYLVENFSKIGNTQQIDENTVVTAKLPLVYYDDIISYDSTEYAFKLSKRAIDTIKSFAFVSGIKAFAIKANNTLIYAGYFWPAYLSTVCDWYVIDPILAGNENKVQVQLGYPGLMPGMHIFDKRNDKRMIQILQRDNKLK